MAAVRPVASAAGCGNETVDVVGTVTVRFVLHGHMSCAEARRTMEAYAKAITQGRCQTEICKQVTFAGAWCSTAIQTLQGPGKPTWGCDRPGPRFDVIKV